MCDFNSLSKINVGMNEQGFQENCFVGVQTDTLVYTPTCVFYFCENEVTNVAPCSTDIAKKDTTVHLIF